MKKKKHDDSALSCSLIRRPIQRWGWLFLLPTFAAFCVGFLYPVRKGAVPVLLQVQDDQQVDVGGTEKLPDHLPG